jgi:hypothetical protein
MVIRFDCAAALGRRACLVKSISHKNFYGLPADEETRKGMLSEARAMAKAF